MKFPYGETNFEKIRTEGYFYVDKTRYIELLENIPESYIVMLRSRRFGKTLFANMLGNYYDRRQADKFDSLFSGTYIHNHPTPKRNAYMILTFNFSGINTQTLENANEGFANEVHSKITLFTGLYKDFFHENDRSEILKLRMPNDILSKLFDMIQEKGAANCIYVIIDEYDHFSNNILSQGKEMFKDLVKTDGYVRPFYEALKKGTGTVVDRIFITGVMPILLDSLTSGFNIAKNKSTHPEFNEMLGFTDEEIQPILTYIGNEKAIEQLRIYYDGYRFSENAQKSVYNSDMILYYATEYDQKLGTAKNMIDINVVSDYRKIRAILSIGDQSLEEQVLTKIVRHQEITVQEIQQLFILTQETEFLFDAKALVSLLFYMGYLTVDESSSQSVTFRMPNLAIKSLYWEYMQYVLMKRSNVQVDGIRKDEMLRNLLSGKIDCLITLTEQLLKGLSNRDYQQFDEKYIKVVMLSLVSNVNLYIPHSEYEVSSDGYVDLFLQAANQAASYFIELKYVKAKAQPQLIDQKEQEGIAAMKKYLQTRIGKSVQHLHPYVLVFRKDRCVRKRMVV